ncbi:MAG: winged helix-turn-helix domain-containing protein [Thermoanaerobaculia bacterium]
MIEPRPPGAAELVGYRIEDGAVVDLARRQLSVGGSVVPCQPLVFRLLVELAGHAGRVRTKDELFAALWPDQVVVSDESLAKLVSKLRLALGPLGERLRTARKTGFLLDARVVPIHLPQGGAEAQTARALPVAVAGAPIEVPPPIPPPIALEFSALGGRERRLRAGLGAALVLLGVALAAGAAGVAWRAIRDAQVLDAGYGLTRGDLAASRDETAELVERALSLVGLGNRTQALVLLRTAHESDPATSIPATVLAFLTLRSEGREGSARWIAEARQRIGPRTRPYARLLAEYVRLEIEGTTEQAEAALAALLEMRPGAWRLRLALAHLHLARPAWRSLALADLRSIEVEALTSGHLAMALADRASLGDGDAVEAILARASRDPRSLPAWIDYVRGRIAFARGDADGAIAAYDRASRGDLTRDGVDTSISAQLLAAIAEVAAGRLAQALERFDRVATRAPDLSDTELAGEAWGLGATVAHLLGDDAGARRRLVEADRMVSQVDWPVRGVLLLRTLETGVAPPRPAAAILAELAPHLASDWGLAELLAARLAFARGDLALARAELGESRRRGVADTPFEVHARLLASELGEPASLCRIDPPYPIPARLGACWELDRRARAATPPAAHPPPPALP